MTTTDKIKHSLMLGLDAKLSETLSTNREKAAHLGIMPQNYSNWLRGKEYGHLSLPRLEEWCRAEGLTPIVEALALPAETEPAPLPENPEPDRIRELCLEIANSYAAYERDKGSRSPLLKNHAEQKLREARRLAAQLTAAL